jgi:1A family penicillin-binding protein
MDAVLIKIFATALTFSQVVSGPEPKTQFDPVADQQQVAALLRSGCQHVWRAFDVESLNVDDLIGTAMDDAEAIAQGHVAFRGINIADLYAGYRQFCKNETVPNSPVDLGQVIEFYNRTLADLPDHTSLKGKRLPGASAVVDRKGARFAEIYEPDQRRVWVELGEIPKHVQQAFIAAEDKRFHEHKGIDERSLIRAFIGNLTQPGRPQGGSTITQQVVKNLLVGDELSYERKMREMVLATRLEQTLSKPEILELYLNSIYLGRASAGVEMAARSYFGKPVGDLSVSEGALLAGITKGPNYFNPVRNPDRAKDRYRYVLGRMKEDGTITEVEAKTALATFPTVAQDDRSERTGSYFADQVARELRTTGDLSAYRVGSYTIHSTLDRDLQKATELALQEGLARYELSSGRAEFQGAELNLADAIARIEGETNAASDKPTWQQALEKARMPADFQWTAAVVIENAPATRRGDATLRVGLADGRIVPLTAKAASARLLKLHDVVLVSVVEGKGKGKTARAELRGRPTVQGAAVVIENQTGRILAMVGGTSYALSQLNRVTQSQRQPGSALKPLTYLAALQKGIQPNSYVRDEDITLPPIQASKRKEDYWSPKNYDGGSSGMITLSAALANSRNLATVNLLDGGIADTAPASLERVCALAVELQIYKECIKFYPFVLGAQPVRPIDLATFYATIANEGLRPSPHVIDAIEQNGETVYRHPATLAEPGSADRASFYQLKAMLQGVLQRGTARAIGQLAPYVAGKTGTTDDENDTWFVGFTNDVTVAVWVGYDNADGKRRTLGGGSTGGSVAVPIFEPIIQAVWASGIPKAPLNPPSAEARKLLVAAGGDRRDERRSRRESRDGMLAEYLRRDAKGNPVDTSRRTASDDRARRRQRAPEEEVQPERSWGWDAWGRQDRERPRWGYDGPRQSPYDSRGGPFFFQRY